MRKNNKTGMEGLILGSARIEVSESDFLPLLNIFLELGVDYSDIICENGIASARLSYPSAKRAERVCCARGIDVKVSLLGGIPYFARFLAKRPGMVVGVIAAALLLLLGSNVLWDVRVEGNEILNDAEVKALLAEKGVRPGAFFDRLDIGTIRAEIESESEEIAWLTVNIIGTVAYVRVVEAKAPQALPEKEGDGINLIAARDGVITGLEVISGEICVQIGQTVREGELLVSGLLDSERLGWRAIESRGTVYAKFESEFCVEIPYEYTVKNAEKSEICEISLIFFSFRQKFFKKCGFSGSNCDTINSDIYIYSSNGRTVPIGLSVTKHPITTESIAVRTRAEAIELAYFELNRRLIADMPNAEILSKSFTGCDTEDGSAYRLVCRVTCIDDISKENPFYIKTSE